MPVRELEDAIHVLTTRGCSQSGVGGGLIGDSPMTETRNKLRGNSLGTMAYMLVLKNLHGTDGMVVLIVEVVGSMEGSGIDGENQRGFGETSLGWS
jgi:hypothetical protein